MTLTVVFAPALRFGNGIAGFSIRTAGSGGVNGGCPGWKKQIARFARIDGRLHEYSTPLVAASFWMPTVALAPSSLSGVRYW
jgi:hypothetical protein